MGDAKLTTISDALRGVSRVGLDTSPFIYLIERHVEYIVILRDLFQRIDQGKVEGVASVLTLTEVLTKPLEAGNSSVEAAYRSILTNSENFSLVQVDRDVAEQAARLRARHGIRTPDAIHVATAQIAGCQMFVTNDHRLRRVNALPLVVLSDLIRV